MNCFFHWPCWNPEPTNKEFLHPRGTSKPPQCCPYPFQSATQCHTAPQQCKQPQHTAGHSTHSACLQPPPFCSSTLVNYINEWQLVPQAVLHTWAGTELTQPSATRSWWAVSQHGGAGVEHPACPQLCLWGGSWLYLLQKLRTKSIFQLTGSL